MSATRDGTTTTATYDDAQQLTSSGSTSYTYDRDGNTLSVGSLSLSYDEANQMKGGTTAGGTALSFGYDGLGRRVSRASGSVRTDNWYDQSGLSLESSSTGGANATYLRDPVGKLLSISSGTSYMNYGTDRQGTTTATTNAAGLLVNTYRYDPWGSAIGVTGSEYNEFRYGGSYRDTTVSMYQMGARYYAPTTGRFSQQDPLPRSVFSANRYAYVGCNPVNGTDPMGLSWLDRVSNYFANLLDRASGAFGGYDPVPQKAYDTLSYLQTNNYAPPPSYTGGRVYQNREGILPAGGDYREYDVDPTIPGVARNAERIVVDLNTGEAWYTATHYNSFLKFYE